MVGSYVGSEFLEYLISEGLFVEDVAMGGLKLMVLGGEPHLRVWEILSYAGESTG